LLPVFTPVGYVVVAQDDTIAKTGAALKDTFKVENIAPGHCTGEPSFAALKRAFGSRYIYAGVGQRAQTQLATSEAAR
jgi:7,8-dihydropterin-6-yl-methyl-4-(beta-D-ribofuranosyl)aminobenzene 5'-phosphate synthase